MPSRTISIRGARTHNLKNVSVDIPQRQLTVLTGPSGSGKSSLAFNTLYAEGQRRFVESMSTYVRQFLERIDRPDIDEITGILPAIAIEQRNTVKNARSTVATATELADHIRLFMTYAGETICPDCQVTVRRETPESITKAIAESLEGKRVVVLAPIFFEKENRGEVLTQLVKAGYYRAWIGGEVRDLNETDTSDFTSLELVINRLRVDPERTGQITEAIEQAFEVSKGNVNILEDGGDGNWISHRFTSRFSCNRCGNEFIEPTPHLFSFNSPLGACSNCQGYGRIIGIDMEKVIPNRALRLDEMPIAPWNSAGYEDCYDDLRKAAAKYRLPLDVPIKDLSAEQWELLYNGRSKWYGIKGFFEWLETKKYKIHVRVKLAKYRSYEPCPQCHGSRLKASASYVTFRGLTIGDLFAMNVRDARRFWELLPFSKSEEALSGHLRREIVNRLTYLDEVGLSYLTLDRQTRTLSGGESQRINLAAALGSSLTETMYVIDEPTVGLHARDSERLLAVLKRLRNAGNTVIVVEHDPTIIAGADQTIELGPGAGEYGGSVLYVGPPRGSETPATVVEHPSSLSDTFGAITIRGAKEHNLKNIDVTIPLGQFVAVTGVSGSGKSTLIRNCLYNRYQRDVRGATGLDVGAATLEGTDKIYDMQFIDQSPIGRSTRSNPATYVKAWDEVRKILSETTAAKLNGVTPGMFSFNTVGGRCDVCEGAGTVTIDMQFLADVEVVCDKCGGKRFNEQVMKVTYKSRNVNDILKMTVDEAMKFFVDKRALLKKLSSLRSVGLGYLRLGQSTASLSGGEAQRLKLASFLSESTRSDSGRLFLFDEPTTGLHHTDVAQLINTFRNLIDRGNSVLVIEHNIQLIEAANHVIDLGPEGGDGGGELIGVGTPEEIAANERSITGRYLVRAAVLPEEVALVSDVSTAMTQIASGEGLSNREAKAELRKRVAP
ncbi:MAG TPA: excinuclease ABC subunit UvrA [Thermoanaerobaculia bacterium]|jgi:excinuclease ABC subunit A|nr:excinuclease ABC subunit UvrA [Thermoanaerobaculia bacterium]